jgi:hypothetical protein
MRIAEFGLRYEGIPSSSYRNPNSAIRIASVAPVVVPVPERLAVGVAAGGDEGE